MGVTAIRLKNFMAFEDTGWIELRPITVLFGKNSSGKSVISRALRLLKQSLKAEPGSGPFVYRTRWGVDVGTFETMFHHGTADLDSSVPTITFSFRCTLGRTLDTLWQRLNQHYQSLGLSSIPSDKFQGIVEFSLKYEWDYHLERARLTNLEVAFPHHSRLESASLIVLAADWLGYEAMTEGEDEWHFRSHLLQGHEVDQQSAWSGSGIGLVSGFLPVIQLSSPDVDGRGPSDDDLRFARVLLVELGETITQFLQQLDYLGPLRPEPEREFVFDAERLAAWQNSGLRGYVRYLRGDLGELEKRINFWLGRLDLCSSVKPVRIAAFGNRALFAAVDVYEHSTSGPKRLPDVGFGLSQVLPIVIQCVMGEPRTTVIIEQPELHLHPSAQSALTDLFIEEAGRARQAIEMTKEKGVAPLSREEVDALRVHFLIETHSEHLLLRLQRRVAESTQRLVARIDPSSLSADDVAVYFVHRPPGEEASRTDPAPLDPLGEIALPPDFRGFFADDAREVALLAGAQLGIDLSSDEDLEDASRS